MRPAGTAPDPRQVVVTLIAVVDILVREYRCSRGTDTANPAEAVKYSVSMGMKPCDNNSDYLKKARKTGQITG